MTNLNPTQRELLAATIEKSHRLYDLQEAAKLAGRARQQFQRWITKGTIASLRDDQSVPARYRIPAKQLAEIVRTSPNGRPKRIEWNTRNDLLELYGQRIHE